MLLPLGNSTNYLAEQIREEKYWNGTLILFLLKNFPRFQYYNINANTKNKSQPYFTQIRWIILSSMVIINPKQHAVEIRAGFKISNSSKLSLTA